MIESLRQHFGHASFRPGQEAVVRAVLEGRDVLAVMPMGSGKSLGVQLPAVLLPGLTIVVSPLIALMKDQVDDLMRRGIPAAAVHSMASADGQAGRPPLAALTATATPEVRDDIVYTATRARAETAAAVLQAAGIDAAAYHGGMSSSGPARSTCARTCCTCG